MIYGQVNPSRLAGVRVWSGALAVSLLLFALIPLLSRPQPGHPEPDGVGANLAPLIIMRPETSTRAEGLRPAHPWKHEPVREWAESAARPAAALEAQASRPEPEAAEPITKTAIKKVVKSPVKPAPATGPPSPSASSGPSEAGNTTTGPVGEPGEAENGPGTGTTGQTAGAAPSGTGQTDRKPAAIRAPRPKYPEAARRRGLEGWVRVRFKVDDQGRVRDVTVVQASPKGVFDRTVLQTLPNWRFRPGSREGRPTATWVETTIKFTLVDG